MVQGSEYLVSLIRKLEELAYLNDSDKQAILALPSRAEDVPQGYHVVREGVRPVDCCLLVAGYACRYKVSSDGGRQILSFPIAGDMLDLQHLYLGHSDHSVLTITKATVAWIERLDLKALAESRPTVGIALWCDTLIEASIHREWVLNVGRRNSKTRVAHMLCEFAIRCEIAGLSSAETFEWPLKQEEMADATGMTPVHVNRVLRMLVTDGALRRCRRGYGVSNLATLRRVAGFDPAYLHAAAA
jgi:CRP-like cAMP-binding protein